MVRIGIGRIADVAFGASPSGMAPRSRRAALAVALAALLVFALMSVFAIELSSTQTTSKTGIENHLHQRAVLAGALISSSFQAVGQADVEDSQKLATARVSNRIIDAVVAPGGYAMLISPDGRVLAASEGLTPPARTQLSASPIVAEIHAGRAYALSNLAPSGAVGTINFAVGIPTAYGTRIIVMGYPLATLSAFITKELKGIPGAPGADNYLVDGRDVILGSTNPQVEVGQTIDQTAALRGLTATSHNIHGMYFQQVPLANSSWSLVIATPDGPLFSSVSGLRRWLPWLIFIAFVIVGITAVALGRRVMVMHSADQLRIVNAQLQTVNGELTEANASLERRASELARSNQDLDQFASIASHDLQEPLRKVRTFTERLTVMEADHLSEKGRDYLLRTNGAATRMQTLIEDLLKFSRVSTQGHPFAPVDLSRVMSGVLDDLASQVDECGSVVSVGSLPTISGDAPQMRQLLQNLLSNALKFRQPGAAPEVTIDARIESDQMVLTIQDNGIGFDERYSERIFRVFERLHGRSEYPGTGIGLALCRKIVERHGGTIVANGQLGIGCTVTTTLPLHQTVEIITIRHFEDSPASSERSGARV